MPPKVVKTLEDMIFWQYAKIIANSAGYANNYGFIMNKYKQLHTGDIKWSSSIREYLKEREKVGECIYCEEQADLTVEHMLPRIRGGPDTTDNVVMVCKHCNSSKKDKRLYEWFGINKRNGIPRIAEGKYLKLLYELHQNNHDLKTADITTLCPNCDLGSLCPNKGQLSVYCLEGLFVKQH